MPDGGNYTTIGEKGLYRFDISVAALEFLELRTRLYTEAKIKKRYPQNKQAFDELCSCFYALVEKIKPILLYKSDKKTADEDATELIEKVEAYFN